MIDIHNHLLHGLDDGAQTLEESIEMCRISWNDGVRIIVATPHTFNFLYENSRSIVLTKVQELNAILPDKMFKGSISRSQFQLETQRQRPYNPGPEFHPSPIVHNLKIIPGADVYFSEEVLSERCRDKISTIADGGKFLLMEFPYWEIPFQVETVLFELLVRGITPIISHPERNLEIIRGHKKYIHMVQMGCLGQITAASLTGDFGRDARQAAEDLLRKQLVHFIASDAHSANGRSPVLSDAVRAAEKIVGKEQAKKMVTEYPQAIIEGRRPTLPEPSL
jgi:protein-tyrosine phosphatase